jgi:hypothetical protein
MLVLLAACRTQAPAATGETGSDRPSVNLDIVGFNVESGGSDPQVVADGAVAPVQAEDMWGFAEVEGESAAKTLVAAAPDPGSDQDWHYVMGTTGFEDRLVLAWDATQFELEDSEELWDINVGGTARAPLVGHFRARDNDARFLVVVNHLWRSEADSRLQQAQMLNAWGADQDEPVVMVGDYNFDWEVETGNHDPGYDALVKKGVFEWVQPKTLVKTQCSGFYDSILDFSFVGGDAQRWDADAFVLDQDRDYCDPQNADANSDHRPVRVDLKVP